MTPSIGIHENVDFDTYLGWSAISNSALNRFRRSPLHYHQRTDDKSPTLAFGRFCHSGQFEPRTIQKRYAVLPAYNLSPENVTKKGDPSTSWSTEYASNQKKAFLGANAGKQLVSQADFDRMLAICEAITSHERANEYLNGPGGRSELSIVWESELTGSLCKARLDRQQPDGIADLKTCRDPLRFEWDIKRYQYHCQAAWYQHGWRVLTGDRLPFRFVAIESESPHGIMAAPIGQMSLDYGHQLNDETMLRLAEAIEADEWPGYESPPLFEMAGIDDLAMEVWKG